MNTITIDTTTNDYAASQAAKADEANANLQAAKIAAADARVALQELRDAVANGEAVSAQKFANASASVDMSEISLQAADTKASKAAKYIPNTDVRIARVLAGVIADSGVISHRASILVTANRNYTPDSLDVPTLVIVQGKEAGVNLDGAITTALKPRDSRSTLGQTITVSYHHDADWVALEVVELAKVLDSDPAVVRHETRQQGSTETKDSIKIGAVVHESPMVVPSIDPDEAAGAAFWAINRGATYHGEGTVQVLSEKITGKERVTTLQVSTVALGSGRTQADVAEKIEKMEGDPVPHLGWVDHASATLGSPNGNSPFSTSGNSVTVKLSIVSVVN